MGINGVCPEKISDLSESISARKTDLYSNLTVFRFLSDFALEGFCEFTFNSKGVYLLYTFLCIKYLWKQMSYIIFSKFYQ